MDEKRIRLIDANALCGRIKEAYWIAQECGAHEAAVFYNALLEEVEQMKTVDAVEVVRCKDCYYFHEYKDGETYCEQMDLYDAIPDGFCNEGKNCKL